MKPSVNHTNNTINLLLHPEMQSLFAAILQVLAPFPEARQAVSEALAGARKPPQITAPRGSFTYHFSAGRSFSAGCACAAFASFASASDANPNLSARNCMITLRQLIHYCPQISLRRLHILHSYLSHPPLNLAYLFAFVPVYFSKYTNPITSAPNILT